jgi:iron complex outermembrane receptor protein
VVSFRSTAGNWLGPELVPLAAVERIEIVRGPASALYGADAFLGVINIITRSPEPLRGADVTAGLLLPPDHPSKVGGDFDGAAGVRHGDFEVLAAARLHGEDWSGLSLPASSPRPTIPAYHLGDLTARDLAQSSAVGLLKLSYHLPRSTTISLTGHYAQIDRGGDFSQWTALSSGIDAQGRQNGTHVALYQTFVALNLQTAPWSRLKLLFDAEFFMGGPLPGDRIEVNSDLFYARRRFGYRGTNLNGEAQLKLPHAIDGVVGVSFLYDDEKLPAEIRVLKQSVVDLMPGQTLPDPLPGSKALFNLGAYAQLVWTPIKRYLTLTGGIRYDYHNIYGNQVSGRLGAVSKPTDKLHLKLLYGSAFKAPSPLLLYGVPLLVGDILGNRNLRPQYVHTFEGEIGYRPFKWGSVSTNLAYNLLLDAAEFSPRGLNQVALNVGHVNSLSWELKAEAHYQEWVRGYVAAEYNYTTRDIGDPGYRGQLIGNGNVIYPRGMLHAGVMGRVPRAPLRLAVELSYVGPRRASETNIIDAGVAYELPSYVLFGASISTVGLELYPKHETVLMVLGRNLTGASAADPGFSGIDYPLAPRMILFQLRQQL